MNWYAIRCIYYFGHKNDGTNVFEERIVVFSGESDKEAFAKADIESVEYAKDNEFKRCNDMELYRQDGEKLIDGYEVWSQLFEAKLSLSEFFKIRYDNFEYVPDP